MDSAITLDQEPTKNILPGSRITHTRLGAGTARHHSAWATAGRPRLWWVKFDDGGLDVVNEDDLTLIKGPSDDQSSSPV